MAPSLKTCRCLDSRETDVVVVLAAVAEGLTAVEDYLRFPLSSIVTVEQLAEVSMPLETLALCYLFGFVSHWLLSFCS